jgi:hypothetical protein
VDERELSHVFFLQHFSKLKGTTKISLAQNAVMDYTNSIGWQLCLPSAVKTEPSGVNTHLPLQTRSRGQAAQAKPCAREGWDGSPARLWPTSNILHTLAAIVMGSMFGKPTMYERSDRGESRGSRGKIPHLSRLAY